MLVFENNQKHEIIIYLDADKSIHRMQCDCIAYRLKKNVCAHLIAALIAIEASKQQNHIVKLSNTIAADGILNIPEMPLPDETHKIKVHVDLIISQDLEKKNLFNQYYLEFKIGLQKSYILKISVNSLKLLKTMRIYTMVKISPFNLICIPLNRLF